MPLKIIKINKNERFAYIMYFSTAYKRFYKIEHPFNKDTIFLLSRGDIENINNQNSKAVFNDWNELFEYLKSFFNILKVTEQNKKVLNEKIFKYIEKLPKSVLITLFVYIDDKYIGTDENKATQAIDAIQKLILVNEDKDLRSQINALIKSLNDMKKLKESERLKNQGDHSKIKTEKVHFNKDNRSHSQFGGQEENDFHNPN